VARLKGAKRQNNQLQLAFEEATTSEARSQSSEGTEASVTECSAESLALDEQWIERICQRENLWQALKRLRRNGGSPGIDGMTVSIAGQCFKLRPFSPKVEADRLLLLRAPPRPCAPSCWPWQPPPPEYACGR
jgi:hypothetical protein